MGRNNDVQVHKVRAAVLRKGGRLRLETIEMDGPRDDEVLVRIVASGIIQGDSVPQRFIPRLIKLYREGRFPFDRLAKYYDFGDINRAIYDARRGAAIKPVLRMGGA